MRHPTKTQLSTGADSGRSMAVAALTFLAADSERLERFLSVTGLGPHNLRAAAADPTFYGSVLDYLLADEPLLVAFAANAGVDPADIAQAQQKRIEPPP